MIPLPTDTHIRLPHQKTGTRLDRREIRTFARLWFSVSATTTSCLGACFMATWPTDRSWWLILCLEMRTLSAKPWRQTILEHEPVPPLALHDLGPIPCRIEARKVRRWNYHKAHKIIFSVSENLLSDILAHLTQDPRRPPKHLMAPRLVPSALRKVNEESAILYVPLRW